MPSLKERSYETARAGPSSAQVRLKEQSHGGEAVFAPSSRHSRHRGLCAGDERACRQCAGDQTLLERDAVRAVLRAQSKPISPPLRTSRATLTALPHRSRDAIAKLYGLDPSRIVCGAGSDELLNLLAAAYLGPGDEAIYSEHGFLVYRIAILAHGATPVVAKETAFTADVDAILASVTPRTRMVFLANPNNPTGTYLGFDEVKRLRAGLPEDVLLVLDAAYAEYVRANDYEAGIELVATTENTVMTRTFSKIYGLAALRIGWAYCPQVVADALNRIRGPFNVSGPAIAAGVAALADRAQVARRRA